MFCSSLSVCNSPACLSSAIHMDNDRHGVFNSAASEPQMIIVKLVFCRVKKDEIGQIIGSSTLSTHGPTGDVLRSFASELILGRHLKVHSDVSKCRTEFES